MLRSIIAATRHGSPPGAESRCARAARLTALLTCCIAGLLATGCASPGGPIFEPLERPVVWPAPPDPPRIHYVGSLASDRDLKPGRSVGQAIGDALFGRQAIREMVSPFAITTDGQRIMVCDNSIALVHVFDLETRRYEQWHPAAGAGHDPFVQPVGIAFDPAPAQPRILVADSAVGGLYAFDLRGRGLGWLGREHLNRPTGIAVDTDRNRILVADAGLHHVAVLSLAGNLLGHIGSRGTGPGEFNFPTNIAIDADGRIYVSDSLNFRVQIFDPDLQFAGQFGERGNRPGHFSQPKGVTVSRHGHIYVVDAHFESVQIFDQQGRLLLSFGQEGRGPGEFWVPAGVFAAADDRIWVADTHNRRIQVFEYREPAQEALDFHTSEVTP
jgi:sugar lactone lactonase YvrE